MIPYVFQMTFLQRSGAMPGSPAQRLKPLAGLGQGSLRYFWRAGPQKAQALKSVIERS
jgi:hypothetical protein